MTSNRSLLHSLFHPSSVRAPTRRLIRMPTRLPIPIQRSTLARRFS